ncbi:MAG: CoB--CoM heterodisulfide reductase iron-sulfur subunit A family protein [Pseudomonadota bacterium]
MERIKPRIGVFICHCGLNIAPRVNVEEVAAFAGGLENVAVAKDYKFMCSSPGQEMIVNEVRAQGLNRVVVASCTPRMHEITFQKACVAAGLNPYQFQMANIREQVSWVTKDSAEATAKAKELVAAAVARVARHAPLETAEVPVHKSVLVIGGGIAGMQAALSAAEAGCQVYLVEREPSIGGHMAKFDKTFPTLDCAACTMTPKMVQVGGHEKITLLTYSEVIAVKGFVGNFSVRVLRKPRYVDEDKCTGCGVCQEKCPTKNIPSEFNEGLSNRAAIFSPFPQALPRTPVIDAVHCRVLGLNKKCGVCEKFCAAGAIDFQQKPREIDLDVGAIILAVGYRTFDPSPLVQYGYGRYPEVYTSLEFERLNNATGPTGGRIIGKNGQVPRRVAIIHCVGSRDKRFNKYCSRVCCMYSLKFAHLVRERTGAEVVEFYIDVRSPGKQYEEFYNRVQEEGVNLVRGRVAEVTDIPDDPADAGRLTVVAENTLTGRVLRVPADMVLLSVGLEPAEGSDQVARLAGVSRDADGWMNELHVKLAPVATPSAGIYLAGCCQGPKDIPDSVAQASAAAGEAWGLLSKGKVRTKAEVSHIDPDLCTGCQTCLQVCPYSAITFNEGLGVAVVNEAVCQGCGSCAAACPSSAAMVRHFTDVQVMDELEALLA